MEEFETDQIGNRHSIIVNRQSVPLPLPNAEAHLVFIGSFSAFGKR